MNLRLSPVFRSFFFIIAALCIFAQPVLAEDKPPCRGLDIREFGLVGDGVNGESWSEVQLIEKFGPPCAAISEGDVILKDGYADSYRLPSGATSRATIASKKKYVYSGGSTQKTSVFTIVDGYVVKKERIY